MSRHRSLITAVTFASILYLGALLWYAQTRPIDGDEGYYTSAARLVGEGKTPYRDFSYPQGAALPYIYSWVWRIHPQSIVALRFLSAACGALSVWLWGMFLVSLKNLSPKVALTTFALIVLNPYWVSWNVVVKTFAVANLLITIALICLYFAVRSRRPAWFFLAGIALGLCASSRSLYAPIIPAVLVWLLYKDWRKAPGFVAGAAVGLFPMVGSFLADPPAFLFNNVRYRSLLGPHETFRHTLHVDLNAIALLLSHPYFDAEMILAIVGAASLYRLRRRLDQPLYLFLELSLLMMVVYAATALIPFPLFDSYYSNPLVPFLVLFVAEGVRRIVSARRAAIALTVLIAAVLCVRDVPAEMREYTRSPYQQLSTYWKVTQAVEANSAREDVVLSFWPGFIFESGRQYLPGAENHFGFDVASRVDEPVRNRYHLVSMKELVRALSAGAADVVVLRPQLIASNFRSPAAADVAAFRNAVAANYSLVWSLYDISVYRCKIQRASNCAHPAMLSSARNPLD